MVADVVWAVRPRTPPEFPLPGGPPFMVISTPSSAKRWAMVEMSARCGRLDNTSVPSVSKLAAINGRAAFFAPQMCILPFSGLPPRM